MTLVFAILGIVCFIVFVCFVALKAREECENYIRSWASNHNYSITSMNQTVVNRGPFYNAPKSGYLFYCVEIIDTNSDAAVYYFRFGGWGGPDIRVWH